jgi:hypothetical protein
VEFGGSAKNNIVLNTNTDPNRGVFLDTHEKNASRRFKMFGASYTEQRTRSAASATMRWLLDRAYRGKTVTWIGVRALAAGSFGTEGTQKTGTRRGGVATLVSADGKKWGGLTSADSMKVAADTANNALYDPDIKKYIAFSRNHCTNKACNESGACSPSRTSQQLLQQIADSRQQSQHSPHQKKATMFLTS